jgi:endoglucanase
MGWWRLMMVGLIAAGLSVPAGPQFAHTEHQQIVGVDGKPLLIRATNLGNWMVPEGYMWLFNDGPQSAAEIQGLVLELLGPEGAETFWKTYRDNYVTREDVALLHRAGFNAIRVPLHYEYLRARTRRVSGCWTG